MAQLDRHRGATDPGADMQLVVFRIGDEEFGVAIAKVQEIIPMTSITQIPRSPDFVKGVLDLRGVVIPVVDLRERFDLPAAEGSAQERIIVVEMADQIVGCIVDQVSEVLTLPAGSVEPPPPAVTSMDSEYLWGVGRFGDRLLLLLDLDKVLSTQEQEALGGVSMAAEGVPLGDDAGEAEASAEP